MAGFNLDDYVDVAERIKLFYEQYPDGRLSTRDVRFCQWPSDGIVATAEAYRTADDPHPGVGTAWEPVPGKTSYTRDSEVQNAETAAWGRAIAACGIGTKRGIASREEVAARQGVKSPRSATPSAQVRPQQPRPKAPATPSGDNTLSTNDLKLTPEDRKVITRPQQRRLFAIAGNGNVDPAAVKEIIVEVTGQDSTAQIPRYLYDRVVQEIELVAAGQVA